MQLAKSSADLEVRVDPSHLHQLLWNLCENALKYGRRDDDDAPVELRTGRISTSDRPFLEILDRGPGIAAAGLLADDPALGELQGRLDSLLGERGVQRDSLDLIVARHDA